MIALIWWEVDEMDPSHRGFAPERYRNISVCFLDNCETHFGIGCGSEDKSFEYDSENEKECNSRKAVCFMWGDKVNHAVLTSFVGWGNVHTYASSHLHTLRKIIARAPLSWPGSGRMRNDAPRADFVSSNNHNSLLDQIPANETRSSWPCTADSTAKNSSQR